VSLETIYAQKKMIVQQEGECGEFGDEFSIYHCMRILRLRGLYWMYAG